MSRAILIDDASAVGHRNFARSEITRASAVRLQSPRRVIAVVGLLGLIVTASLSWTAWRIDRNTEHRLLQVQTKQAVSVVASAIISLEGPLSAALDIAAATGGNVTQFTAFMSGYTGANALFVSTSLWQTKDGASNVLASTGTPLSTATASAALIARASTSSTFVVGAITTPSGQGVSYALANPKTPTYAIYAERAIPPNRRVPVESNSAFADLHFATYLGATTSVAALQTTDVALNQLPLSGDTVRESIPFGDTTLTLVTSPIDHLGGAIGGRLPWILLVGGVVITAAAAQLAGRLVRRRRDAEQDALTITELYERLDGLFSEQRTISETLQRALLPQTNPSIPTLEIGSRYVAGARGVDVGGDWYSIIALSDNRFGFVVGDVSGRGVEAAAHMARIRFTLRAYLIEGHPPNIALDLCSLQLDFNQDRHFATVLIGTGDLSTRELTLANAGHLNPLLISNGRAQIVTTAAGLPLGLATTAYRSTTVAMSPQTMLMAFTDGLVERRDEDIDAGIGRLAEAAERLAKGSVDEVLTSVLATMSSYTGSDDDIAILAFRWTAVTALAFATEAHDEVD